MRQRGREGGREERPRVKAKCERCHSWQLIAAVAAHRLFSFLSGGTRGVSKGVGLQAAWVAHKNLSTQVHVTFAPLLVPAPNPALLASTSAPMDITHPHSPPLNSRLFPPKRRFVKTTKPFQNRRAVVVTLGVQRWPQTLRPSCARGSVLMPSKRLTIWSKPHIGRWAGF